MLKNKEQEKWSGIICDLDKLQEYGIKKRINEYEKAHTYPVSQPFWYECSPYDLFKDYVENAQKKLWTYFHVPFCFYKCKYCFYHKKQITMSQDDLSLIDVYLKSLKTEVDYVKKRLNCNRIKVSDLYIGGGTPTCLDKQHLKKLLRITEENFDRSSDFLGTIECTPDSIDRDKVKLIKDSGFSRISMGIQSAAIGLLKFSDRGHDVEQAFRAFDLMQNQGIQHINIDLIYGFPDETPTKWEQVLQKVVSRISPGSITLYYLRYVPGTEITRMIHESERVEWEKLLEMRKIYIDLLHSKGYEMWRPHMFIQPKSHIKRYRGAPTLDSINNGSQIGFGPSAYSHLGYNIGRNARPFERWMKLVQEHGFGTIEGKELSLEDQYTRKAVKTLCNGYSLKEEDFKQEFNVSIDDIFGQKLKVLKELELIDRSNGQITLTKKGILVDEEVIYFFYPENTFNLAPLEISNRISNILKEVRRIMQDREWINKTLEAIEAPGFAETDVVSKMVVHFWDLLMSNKKCENLDDLLTTVHFNNKGDDFYHEVQSRILSIVLNHAMDRVKYGNKNEFKDFHWVKKSLMKTNLNYILPSLVKVKDEYQISFDQSATHFGSFSFHPSENYQKALHKETYSNITFKKMVVAKKRKVVKMTRQWISDCMSELESHNPSQKLDYSDINPISLRLLKIFKKKPEKKENWQDDLSDQEVFQEYISQILSKKQNTFLAEVGAVTPFVFLQLSKKRKNRRLEVRIPSIVGDGISNVFEFRGPLEPLIKMYMNKTLTCPKQNKAECCLHNGNTECKGLSGEDEIKAFLDAFREKLIEYNLDESGEELIRDLRYPDLLELLFPFVYFGQPVLISSQYSRGKNKNAISFSIALNPFLDDSEEERAFFDSKKLSALLRWTSIVANGLHSLVTNLSRVITEIEEVVSQKLLGRSQGIVYISHTLRSEIDSNILPYINPQTFSSFENFDIIAKENIETAYNRISKMYNLFTAFYALDSQKKDELFQEYLPHEMSVRELIKSLNKEIDHIKNYNSTRERYKNIPYFRLDQTENNETIIKTNPKICDFLLQEIARNLVDHADTFPESLVLKIKNDYLRIESTHKAKEESFNKIRAKLEERGILRISGLCCIELYQDLLGVNKWDVEYLNEDTLEVNFVYPIANVVK